MSLNFQYFDARTSMHSLCFLKLDRLNKAAKTTITPNMFVVFKHLLNVALKDREGLVWHLLLKKTGSQFIHQPQGFDFFYLIQQDSLMVKQNITV